MLLKFIEGYTTPSHNLAGPDRAMAYRVALGTGFRTDELRSLTPTSFDLEADPPTITIKAAYSKRRRQDVLRRKWHVEACQKERGGDRIRTDGGGFAIRWLSHLPTPPGSRAT